MNDSTVYSRARASLAFMQLQVPELTTADAGSFPQDPDEVATWLARLDPLESDADARELLRGLTHSNRLVNDVDRRRTSLVHFLGPLRAVHEQLMESARAQPLPLTRDFSRDAALADALLREEFAAFRLLLADSQSPLEADARRAMHALLRRAALAVHGHQAIPAELWRDAHNLYQFSESHELSSGAEADPAGELPLDVTDHYRQLLLLGIIDPYGYRARQLPLLLEWLRERSYLIAMSTGSLDTSRIRQVNGRWLVDMARGTAPAPCGSMLVTDASKTLLIDTRPLRIETERRISTMSITRASLLGADTLERQTLTRLTRRLEPDPYRQSRRRQARRREARAVDCVFSHKYISARLLYESGHDSESAKRAETGNAHVEPLLTPRSTGEHAWLVVDSSASGCQLQHPSASPGSVQVGELVSLHDPVIRYPDGTGSTRRDILLGIVRRVNAHPDGRLNIGIESMARAVLPVIIRRDDETSTAPENGLIIACRTGTKTVQTILVPPFLYQSGDRLSAMQGERSTRIELTRCLQLNGLFSQYQLKTATAD